MELGTSREAVSCAAIQVGGYHSENYFIKSTVVWNVTQCSFVVY
jgi:hypothetical protein